MKISAVIPTYNRPETSIRAIESILAQSRPCDEILVVNDASTDSTLEKLLTFKKERRLEQLKVIDLKKNRGVSGARNKGIQAASNDWLAFLDSDDEWHPDKLKIQFESLIESGLKISHTDEEWIRNGKRINQKFKHKKYGGSVFEKCLDICFIGPSTSILHKSIFDEAGLFDEELTVCEDYDLWLRTTHKYDVHYIDQILLTKYGGHEDQLSTAFIGMDYWRLLALKKQLENTDLSAEQTKAVQEKFDDKFRILKHGCEKHQNLEMLQKLEFLTLKK